MNPSAAIVIPAHNESRSIRRCLDAILQDAKPGEFEIIVGCNGCTDDTASIASSYGDKVQVLEIDEASKPAALNAAEKCRQAFPIFYVDADVEISTDSVRKVIEKLGSGQVHAASPRVVMDFGSASWLVRAYYSVWLSTPYCRAGLMGAGITALSEDGRRRFQAFPKIIADDGFVRMHFKDSERCAVEDARVIVRAPRTMSGLIKIKTRSRLGGYELASLYPELVSNDRNAIGKALLENLRIPWRWPSFAVYLFVNLLCRRRAQRQLLEMECYSWERDESSRV